MRKPTPFPGLAFSCTNLRQRHNPPFPISPAVPLVKGPWYIDSKFYIHCLQFCRSGSRFFSSHYCFSKSELLCLKSQCPPQDLITADTELWCYTSLASIHINLKWIPSFRVTHGVGISWDFCKTSETSFNSFVSSFPRAIIPKIILQQTPGRKICGSWCPGVSRHVLRRKPWNGTLELTPAAGSGMSLQ